MRQPQRQIPPGGSFAGASHVLLGSDYPFDMGTLECARQVKALSRRPTARPSWGRERQVSWVLQP